MLQVMVGPQERLIPRPIFSLQALEVGYHRIEGYHGQVDGI
jgi:hypothetical protein